MCRRTCTTTSIDDSSQLFCMFKSFEGIDNGGGLTVPQDIFVQHVTQMEDPNGAINLSLNQVILTVEELGFSLKII